MIVITGISESPVDERVDETGPPAYLLPLSSDDPAELRRLAAGYADLLAVAVTPDAVVDVCFAAGARPTGRHRRAACSADRDGLIARLRAIAAEPNEPEPVERATVAFVFPGQGAQRTGMGRELLATVPRFAEHLRACDRAIRAEAGWSVLDHLLDDSPSGAESRVQPALWALQVGLAMVWRDWGVEPDVVFGSSLGEIAAAVAAGTLSLSDGAAVVCRRSALFQTLEGCADMWAVQLGEAAAWQAIGELADQVAVAAVNSPHFTTIAGAPDACRAVVAPLLERRVFCRRVKAGLASHTPVVDPILPQLRELLADVRPTDGRIPFYSTVIDGPVPGGKLGADYWAANLRQPVRFADACRALLADHGRVCFVEVGPQATLTASIEDNIESGTGNGIAVPSIRRDWSEAESLMTSLGVTYEQGSMPVWHRLHEYTDRR